MKKSKFDIVYESIKEDLKKRLCLEDTETEQEDPVLEDDVTTEENEADDAEAKTETDAASDELANEDDTVNEEDEKEDAKDPELVKEFLDNLQVNAQGAASGNDVKVSAV